MKFHPRLGIYREWMHPFKSADSRPPGLVSRAAAGLWHEVVKRMQEVLELAGTASDYHFALAGAVGSLFGLLAADSAALRHDRLGGLIHEYELAAA